MPACEKCWADAYSPYGDQPERYRELLKQRADVAHMCTPRQQAGDWWDEETQSDTRITKEQDPAHEK